jgi:membrane associated rhomboid family serine protease
VLACAAISAQLWINRTPGRMSLTQKPKAEVLPPRNAIALDTLAACMGIGSIAIGADGASVAWQAHIGGFWPA